MRLSKIKLAGFKSFVDPTTVHFPSNLVGIVGPNGCGKSNVIDAIRWVMGESSAKHLRGDSMADVIFNGSASRKPVGTASIELYFDNADGSIGGQYARYAEVCIKRSVSRDGMSQYFLNNVRCRRKDITGIFLGTGLGPRSYAIIEQGMISRLIEAKPDEMRVYIEEAAGISKYKERRRETENRIRHARDNIDRLNDLREEVENQIKHLQRQAKQAERYKKLKQNERLLEAELFAIRLTDLQKDLERRELQLSRGQTALEAVIAEQRGIEARIEQARQHHIEASEAFNKTQGSYYGVQSEISRLEQSIAHSRETRQRQSDDLTQAEAQLTQVGREIDDDREQLHELDNSLERLAPDLERAREAEIASAENLKRVEGALENWQTTWHEFTAEAQGFEQTCNVENTRIEQLEARLSQLRDRDAQLAEEQQGISIAELEKKLDEQARCDTNAKLRVDSLHQALEEINREILQLREQEQMLSTELEGFRGELESRRGRVETLEALQEAAFGQDQQDVTEWIARERLDENSRLAQKLVVDKGWEQAVETVLGDFLQAICVTRCDEHLGRLPDTDLVLIDRQSGDESGGSGTLLAKVRNAGSAAQMLRKVLVAESLDAALALRERSRPGETVITEDGVWLGPGWVRISRRQQEAGGLISREKDIRGLRDRIQELEQTVVRLEADRTAGRSRLEQLESDRSETSAQAAEANRQFAEATVVLAGLKDDFARIKERLTNLTSDSQQVRDELESLEQAVRDSQGKLSHARDALERISERRPLLERQREDLLEEFNQVRETAGRDREAVSRIQVEYESRRASRESANTSLTRIQAQREQLEARVKALSGGVAESEAPLQSLQQELDSQLAQEINVERELAEQRRKLEDAETQLRSEEAKRTDCEKEVNDARESVDGLRMQVREIEVRREGVAEQFAQSGLELDQILANLDEEAELSVWEERLNKARRSIDRLGAINLAAIGEFSEQSERKVYLDAQLEDLNLALDTLEGAIRKIDRETRTRFRETFDNVNSGLQRLFPKLFGGGHAYLSLDGDDLLRSGVTVMARPPGKRNSSIHLLSGGEKALTAVALVFSIFELNPAPFCLLDEVDAPLDDTNVARFCEIVREMADTVQFLIITHNKTTMEMASQLTGVTMNEPGVSRLVSVDIDAAVQLVAS
jgi:chromosome segregation protein